MKQLYVILFTFISFISSAQELLKDIITSNASSHPRVMVEANGKQYFVAKGGNSNKEIWVSDGTPNGTNVVANYSQNNGLYIDGYNLYVLNQMVFFTGYSYNPNYTGTELWVTDGTTVGTHMVKDINPGQGSSNPGSVYKLGNKMVFMANDGVNGTELWVTDGTADGTYMLGDLNPGSLGSYFYTTPVLVNNKLFFTITTQNEGSELWVTDGSPAGTYIVRDIYPGNNSSGASYLTAVGNKLFFIANDGISGRELWSSDGTNAGTNLVKDMNPGSNSTSMGDFFEYNGKLLFASQDTNYDTELWISDGTSAGTYLLKNIAANTSSYPRDFIKVGNTVFFTANDGINGRELWKTNGTMAGTQLVKDINSTSIESDDYTFSSSSARKKFIAVNGKLFFLANSGLEGFELWKSDGTEAGTTLVNDFSPGTVSATYGNFMAIGSNLIFTVATSGGESLFLKTDGTNAGTVNLRNANPSLTFKNEYPLMVSSMNQFYFVAYNNVVGYELFKTDGNSVSLVKDIETSIHYGYNNFSYKAGINNNLIFTYDDNEHGLELWKTNGYNTNLFMDFVPYPQGGIYTQDYYSASSTFYNNFVSLNGYVYIVRSNGLWRTNGEALSLWQSFSSSISAIGVSGNKIRILTSNKLYETDGTNINLVKTLDDWNYYGYSGAPMYDVNGTSYFVFSTYQSGFELWKTDGTEAGTVMVKDITPGPNASGFLFDFRRVGNKMFFVCNNGNGYELWITDGTEWGTYQVKDIYPGTNSSSPDNLTNYNDNLLIFSAINDTNGREIWKSDGTYDGTVMISDIYSGYYGSYPSNYGQSEFAIYNSKVYFSASRSNYGSELYSTDGNSVNLVKDGLNASQIIKFNDELFFSGYSFTNYIGSELWKSNGTTAGTTLVKDIYPGPNYSSPSRLFVYNNSLYFMANDGITGNELWIMKPCADSLNFNSALTGKNTYQVSKVIVGEIANTISAEANITYDAGKYILLNPGFSTLQGAVFQSSIGGCSNNLRGNSNENAVTSQTSDKKTEEYLQDIKEMPSLEDFIQQGNNKDLKMILAKFEESKQPFIDSQRKLTFELKSLEKQKTEAQTTSNQQALNNYYTTKLEKERAFEINKQELDQFSYFIGPVRNERGEKTGYDLTIYAGGKTYLSSIRY